MTPKLKVKLVLQLRDQGLNRTEIASSRHISRKNVNEIFSIAQEKGLTYQSVKDLICQRMRSTSLSIQINTNV